MSMRLLNVYSLESQNFRSGVPKYAIASHRWSGADNGEASLKDVRNGLDPSKRGHQKVLGFAEYIRKNLPSIEWLWMDTCCIDKESTMEKSTAINSLLRWYQNAEACFAYMADVGAADDLASFSASIWFRRGWTLQELLVPHLVVFLAKDWQVIGHKGGDGLTKSGEETDCGQSLTGRIAGFTQIPRSVLDDYAESHRFSANAKARWADGRETTIEEDEAYCLFGILDVAMPVIYGEGRDKAMRRLWRELGENPSQNQIQIHPERQAPSDNNPLISVPSTAVSNYIERSALSRDLEEKMDKLRSSHALKRVVTVSGLMGAGKTQLVLRYIESCHDKYDHVLWLDLNNEETTRESFRHCARAIPHTFDSSGQATDRNGVPEVQHMLRWFQARRGDRPWLAVLDNVHDFSDDLDRVMPKGSAGCVIVISRDGSAARMLSGKHRAVKVGAMSTGEATRLLRDTVDLDEEDELDGDRTIEQELVAALHCFPLAVDLVGSAIRAEADAGENVHDLMRRCLQTAAERPFPDERTIRPCTEDEWTKALQLLQLFGTLETAGIHDDLFRLAALGLPEACRYLSFNPPDWFQELLCLDDDGEWDDTYYRAAMRPLLQYRLLLPSTSTVWEGMYLPEMVRWRSTQWGSSRAYFDLFMILLTAACDQYAVDSNTRYVEPICVCLPSTAQILSWKPSNAEPEPGWICFTVARLLVDAEKFAAAAELYEAALKQQTDHLGEEHADTISTMLNLAATYREQQKYHMAEAFERKVIELRTRTGGRHGRMTLNAINNLGTTYLSWGRLGEAERLLKEVVRERSRLLGADNQQTLMSRAHLAETVWKQGRLNEALEMDRAVFQARLAKLGKDHPSVLSAASGLAVTLQSMGQWEEAERMQTLAVEGKIRVLGKNNPTTVASIRKLGEIRRREGYSASALMKGDNKPKDVTTEDASSVTGVAIRTPSASDEEDASTAATNSSDESIERYIAPKHRPFWKRIGDRFRGSPSPLRHVRGDYVVHSRTPSGR